MTIKNIAFYSSVTEYERNWSPRPDGYLVALTKPQFIARAAIINAPGNYDDFSRTDGGPRMCEVTEEMYRELTASKDGCVWVLKNNKDWMVQE